MSEQRDEGTKAFSDEGTQPSKSSLAKKVGLGAALAVLPLGVVQWMGSRTAPQEKDPAARPGQGYDLAALRRVDPELVKYRLVGQIQTGLERPSAIHVDQMDRLLVAGEGAVRIFDTHGAHLASLRTTSAAKGLTTDASGNIYTGARGRVEVFDSATGESIRAWELPGDQPQVTSIAVAGDDVFVADAGGRVVWKFDHQGNVTGELGRKNDRLGVPGLIVPSPHMDVAIDADGLVWIANPGRHQLEAYQTDGSPVRTWGARGTGIEQFIGCCNPSDFAILATGGFVTAEKGTARVKVYRSDGSFECVVATPAAFAENMLGLDVAADSTGRVLVLEPGSRDVRVYQRVD